MAVPRRSALVVLPLESPDIGDLECSTEEDMAVGDKCLSGNRQTPYHAIAQAPLIGSAHQETLPGINLFIPRTRAMLLLSPQRLSDGSESIKLDVN